MFKTKQNVAKITVWIIIIMVEFINILTFPFDFYPFFEANNKKRQTAKAKIPVVDYYRSIVNRKVIHLKRSCIYLFNDKSVCEITEGFVIMKECSNINIILHCINI